MSRNDKILDFVLKRKPYEDIECGFKLEEYREDDSRTNFWAKRFLTEEGIRVLRTGIPLDDLDWLDNTKYGIYTTHFYAYDFARFSLGYQPGRPSFIRKINRIKWGLPRKEWTYGIVGCLPVFITELDPCT